MLLFRRQKSNSQIHDGRVGLDGVKSEMIVPAVIWSCELPDRPATIIPSFYLEKVGHHIEVPVSKKVLAHFTL